MKRYAFTRKEALDAVCLFLLADIVSGIGVLDACFQQERDLENM